MALFSGFTEKKEETALLIDIGNGTITGAIALFTKGKKPEFLYANSVPFAVREMPNAEKLVEDMNMLLESLLGTLMKQGFAHPYWQKKARNIPKALVAFSSPWFVSKTKHLNLSKDRPFVITESFVAGIVRKEEEDFRNELLKSANADDGDTFELVEKSIVHTKINGYTLDSSIGKKTRNFDSYLCLAMISQGVVNKVESILLKHAHIPKEKTVVHTFPLISFTVIRDVFSASSDFLILDITAEVTDVTLVKNDVIDKSVSVPSGRNFIIRQIMKSFEVTSEIADSTLHLYVEEKLDAESVQKMEQVLVNVEKEWSIYFENALLELSADMILPSSTFMTAEDDVANIYAGFLNLSKTDSTATFRKSLNLMRVDKETTSQFFESKLGSKVNEFVALLAIFYNKIFQ